LLTKLFIALFLDSFPLFSEEFFIGIIYVVYFMVCRLTMKGILQVLFFVAALDSNYFDTHITSNS